MAKNIVVFSDGTGQDGGETTNTNVYKLFNMIEDRTDKQIGFYDRGLGTGRQRLLGQAAGKGISRNIQDCYRFIFENYQAGDRIYLFGFSRGAATVRSLSSFIHHFGILPKSRPELIKKAYRIYRMPAGKKRDAKAEAFVALHHTMWAKIRFLGVWDTVAALGVPFPLLDRFVDRISFFKHRFHDFALSESVEHGYHALAVDDARKPFHPTLWEPDDKRVTQVWFCGMHTDVGGGYREPELSDITLDWMVARAQRHGLRIHYDHKVAIYGNNGQSKPNGKMHNSFVGVHKLFGRKTRAWDEKRTDVPKVHQSVLDRKKIREDQNEPPYNPWILQLDEAERDVEHWLSYTRPPKPDDEENSETD